MNRKRLVSFVTIAALVFTLFTAGVYAEKIDEISYEADDNFQDLVVTDNTVPNWEVLNTPALAAESGDAVYGSSLKITTDENAESEFNGILKTLSSAITESQYIDIDFDFKAADEQIPAVYFAYTDDNDAAQETAIWFADGKIYTGDAVADRISVGTYANPSDWHSATIRVNGYNHTYNITIDGTAVAANKIAGYKDAVSASTNKRYELGNATSVGFIARKGSECLFDNIAIKKTDRADYRPAQNFRTDFEELQGDRELPEGFYEPVHNSNNWSYVGGGNPDNSPYGTSVKVSNAASGPSGPVIMLRDIVKTDIVTIEYDSYVDTDALAHYHRVLYLYTSAFASAVSLNDNAGTWELRAGSGTSEKFTKTFDEVAKTWVHNKLVLNFGTGKMSGSIGDKDFKECAMNSTIKSNGLAALYFQNNSTNKSGFPADGAIYIDNLSITTEPLTNVGDPITDDFETYSNLTELKAGAWAVNGTITDARVSFPEETGHGKVLKIARETGVDVQGLVKNISPAATGGTITLKASVKLEGSDMKALIYMRKDANNHYPIVALDPREGGLIAVGMGGDLTAHKTDSRVFGKGIVEGNWYDVAATIDVSRELLSVTVTDQSGELDTQSIKNVPFRDLELTGTVDQIASFRFQMQSALGKDSGTATGVYLDDIEITHKISASISPERISLIDYDGKTEDNTTAAAPSVNKIVINFGGTMSTESLLKKVSLTKAETGGTVKYIGDNDTSRYTYTLSIPDMLEPNMEYKLSIPSDVLTAQGTELGGTNFEFLFTTGDGEMNASLDYMKVGATEVTAKADLNAGDIAEVGLNYFNSTNTDNDVYLIYGYYKDGELISANYRHIPLNSSVKDISLKYLEKIDRAVSDADNVKVFLWNGLDKMYPLSKNLDF